MYSQRGDRNERENRDRDDRRDRRPGPERSERRRSRSPGPRHAARRDYDVDSYSSSRDHRAREREDRYAGGRDRRDDRGWDRDRGGRRDRDGDRPPPPRRERDPFDDRRGNGMANGRGRGDRDRGDRGDRGDGGFRAQTRGKSDSPPPKPREPTPDLTDVVPILERQRRLRQWDIKPQGYENVTSEQAKHSGMFPLPGAPRQQPMDSSRLQALANQPGNSAVASALKPAQGKQSKRLIISNLPATVDNNKLAEFFNLQLNGLNVIAGVDPCVSAIVSPDHSYALLEFKTGTDATVALALDGIAMEEDDTANGGMEVDSNGLLIRRPKDYIAPTAEEAADSDSADIVKDSPDKILISNIPIYMTEDMVKEVLQVFGLLKSFVLAKDTSSEESRVSYTDPCRSYSTLPLPSVAHNYNKGFAFCEFALSEVTKLAIQGLDGMEMVGSNIGLKLASVGLQQASGMEASVGTMSILASTVSTDQQKSRVLMLMNMVTIKELNDNEEYAGKTPCSPGRKDSH